MPSPITDELRKSLAQRIPVGSYNQNTGQVESRPMDATDVMGLVDPFTVAIGRLEDLFRSLKDQ